MDNFRLLEEEVLNNSNIGSNDRTYFDFHKKRFQKLDQFLNNFESNRPHNSESVKVLEIGSHYLHTSILLSSRSYDVDSMDVEDFWNLDFVKSRAERFKINSVIENDISRLKSFENVANKYDMVVFTEILEHITFNPIRFWKLIYQILKPGGLIYISTPNAFALPNYIRNLKNMIGFRSIGISVEEIFSKVTYGHHWKEYTSKEIKQYFNLLSDDFETEVNPYNYKDNDLKPPYLLFKLLSKIGNKTNFFADDLEVIVRLKEKRSWKIKEPEY